MKNKLSLIQAQKHILAPALQKSVQVLLLSLTELNASIEEELQNNPLLDIEENAVYKTTNEKLPTVQIEEAGSPNFFEAPDNEFLGAGALSRNMTLEENLLRQLHVEFDDPDKIKIGEMIIGNLDDDGYLRLELQEIAQICQEPLQEIEGVLKIIHTFEPLGIATRGPKESLLVQLGVRYAASEVLGTAQTLISDFLEEMARNKFPLIAKKLKTPLENVQRAAKLILSLDPKPARNYRPLPTRLYVKPDVFIEEDTDKKGYRIYSNRRGYPSLKINATYKNMLNRPDLKDEERAFILEKLATAAAFLKSLEQREQTICRICKFIVDNQPDFFSGQSSCLRPLNLKMAAQQLERNESTISRAISNKYAQTPQGLFPLKFFFSGCIKTGQEKTASVQSIKEEMRELIDNETRPLCDKQIQVHFEEKHIFLARRTIAKYRTELNILPSHLRKKSIRSLDSNPTKKP